jgi:hypothetical protein
MCLVSVCRHDEREVSRRPAPRSCDSCRGMVQIVEVDSQWNFCFLPLRHKIKTRHYCTKCFKKFNVRYYKPLKESTTSSEERTIFPIIRRPVKNAEDTLVREKKEGLDC